MKCEAFTFYFFVINLLSSSIFTVFGQFIRGQSVTQRNMGREAPRYPPQYPGPMSNNSSCLKQHFKNIYLVFIYTEL